MTKQNTAITLQDLVNISFFLDSYLSIVNSNKQNKKLAKELKIKIGNELNKHKVKIK